MKSFEFEPVKDSVVIQNLLAHTQKHTQTLIYTVEPQWLEHPWDHENLFEIWVVRAIVD